MKRKLEFSPPPKRLTPEELEKIQKIRDTQPVRHFKADEKLPPIIDGVIQEKGEAK